MGVLTDLYKKLKVWYGCCELYKDNINVLPTHLIQSTWPPFNLAAQHWKKSRKIPFSNKYTMNNSLWFYCSTSISNSARKSDQSNLWGNYLDRQLLQLINRWIQPNTVQATCRQTAQYLQYPAKYKIMRNKQNYMLCGAKKGSLVRIT